jgi:hypothetical protein
MIPKTMPNAAERGSQMASTSARARNAKNRLNSRIVSAMTKKMLP